MLLHSYEVLDGGGNLRLLMKGGKLFAEINTLELKELQDCADEQVFEKKVLEIRERLLR